MMTIEQKVLRRLSSEWQSVDHIISTKTFKERNRRLAALSNLVEIGTVEHQIVGSGSSVNGEYRLISEYQSTEKSPTLKQGANDGRTTKENADDK